jgi:hypothetical protein
MILDTKEQVFLIQNETGLFWAPDEQVHTTSPGWVGNPAEAKRITVTDFDAEPKEPAYYVENSDRMRRWLKGCRTIKAEITTHIEVKLLR